MPNFKWVEEPLGIWAYVTTARRAMSHSPFAIAYGVEAWAPIEAKNTKAENPQIRLQRQQRKTQEVRVELNLLEEKKKRRKIQLEKWNNIKE